MMDFELWIFDSFWVFLRFEITKNFSYYDGVIQVPVVEVHIGEEVFIERAEETGHIGFVPTRIFQQDHSPGHGSVREVVQIDRRSVASRALGEETLGGSGAQGSFPSDVHWQNAEWEIGLRPMLDFGFWMVDWRRSRCGG
jgi:hypothetical protein